jgi:hypothetical protein
MCRAVGGFDLCNPVLQALIVRPRLGELVINLERELPVALLQIQLRHGFVDERLRRRTREHPIILL